MAFAPGDRVHISRLGTGVVLEVRNRRRYLVEIKGLTMVVDGGTMERAERTPTSRRGKGPARGAAGRAPAANAPASLDLHGLTTEEAVAALDSCLNDALLAQHAAVRVIHGRSGGRLKAAVHARLKQLPVVRAFRVDPANAGVTIVVL